MKSSANFLSILVLLVFLAAENARAQPQPILINCGSDSTTSVDARTWIGDSSPSNNFTLSFPGAIASAAPAPAPGVDGEQDPYGDLYKTARVFNASSSYRLAVAPGSYFLRLHFSQQFANLGAQEPIFSVAANGLRLLSKFSVHGEISWRDSQINSTSSVIVKEYLLNVTSGKLGIEFTPDEGSFAFINAMEVLPVSGTSIFDSVNKVDAHGLKGPFSLDGDGIETMYRLCVGCIDVLPRKEDPGLWRRWDKDEHFIFSLNAANSIFNSSNISYVSADDPTVAPLRLYQSARVPTESSVLGKKFNVSWSFNIDPGFDYLVRLHFCEQIGRASCRERVSFVV